jgi:hypothetical protein
MYPFHIYIFNLFQSMLFDLHLAYREFESVCDKSVSKIKPIFPVVQNTQVEIKSGFAIQRGMLQYPCVQVHVEWKKDAKDSRTTDTFLGYTRLSTIDHKLMFYLANVHFAFCQVVLQPRFSIVAMSLL